MMELGHAGMPGPLLESHLAVFVDHDRSAKALAGGQVTTSVRRGSASALVAWGAVADLVLDQRSGEVLSEHPLPAASLAYPLPHGWIDSSGEVDHNEDDALAVRRWIVAAALVVGLSEAALDRTCGYAKERIQFGRPIGSFQAVQTRLVESALYLRATRRAVVDASWRVAERIPNAEVAAAIAWLSAYRTGQLVGKHCHQVHGATGFTLETGLSGLTWPIWWLRESVGRRSALEFLTSRRLRGNRPITRVFEAFN
jgi:hypothetical protein